MFLSLFLGSGEGERVTRLEGVIQRKHEWETATTKASHRTWDKLYAVLHENDISFYKDHKHARSVSTDYFMFSSVYPDVIHLVNRPCP